MYIWRPRHSRKSNSINNWCVISRGTLFLRSLHSTVHSPKCTQSVTSRPLLFFVIFPLCIRTRWSVWIIDIIGISISTSIKDSDKERHRECSLIHSDATLISIPIDWILIYLHTKHTPPITIKLKIQGIYWITTSRGKDLKPVYLIAIFFLLLLLCVPLKY